MIQAATGIALVVGVLYSIYPPLGVAAFAWIVTVFLFELKEVVEIIRDFNPSKEDK